jgi:diketogulonate reductase-like aldo/keto reductase
VGRPHPRQNKDHRLKENSEAVEVKLTAEDLEEITAAADKVEVEGERYPEHMQRWINR